MKMLGHKDIQLAICNLKSGSAETLAQTLVLRLGPPENHREMVWKCIVPVVAWLMMNECSLFNHHQSSWKQGSHEPLNVIVWLHMDVSLGCGRVQSFYRVLAGTHGSRKLRDK